LCEGADAFEHLHPAKFFVPLCEHGAEPESVSQMIFKSACPKFFVNQIHDFEKANSFLYLLKKYFIL